MPGERFLRDGSIVVTGATGFVGNALVRRLVGLNKQEGRRIRIWPVSREHQPALAKLAERGDIAGVISSDFERELDVDDQIDLIFHCATPASAILNATSPSEMFRLNVAAMEWVTNSPIVLRHHPRVVFTSSGAVYGAQPPDLERIPENFGGAPDTTNPKSAYAEGKRAAEFLLCEAGARGLLEPVIARLFAFSGVGLPLDRHFAIGNFVNDVRHRRTIAVRGTGTAVRSYMDVADMVEWLLAAAERGKYAVPYHVGSDQPITIVELAALVAERGRVTLGHETQVEIQGTTSMLDGADRYVPETATTRAALGVGISVTLEQSIDQMLLQ